MATPYLFFNSNGENIGGVIFNASNPDNIYSEYQDSVEDFDPSILRRFNFNLPIVNIEDMWINRTYRGNNYFRQIFNIAMEILQRKYSQFILRACSDNNFPEEKLVALYREFGFREAQETDSDGTIMICC